MSPPPVDQIKPFLPPGVAPSAQAAPAPRAGHDREASPRVKRDRELGDYGYKVLDLIYKDYEAQIKVWKNAFKDVTAAYATAVDMRIKTFQEADEERKAEAAFDAFIFSLVTGGAMVLLGAWVQYSLVPSFVTRTAKWDFSKGLTSVPGLTVTTTEKFSRMQAAMFGGIVKDVGGKIVSHAFPEPKRLAVDSYPMDQPSVAANMDADFGRLVDDSAEVVLKQLRDVQTWMNEGTEFGDAWLKYAHGSVEQARTEIRLHLDKLRQEWAKDGQFFGQTPRKIQRKFLAEEYERALWAGLFAKLYDPLFEPIPGSSMAEKLEKAEGSWFMDGLPGGTPTMERAFVNRLKDLNVVFAETNQGNLDQANRMIEGAPRPQAYIDGRIDNAVEMVSIYRWATGFLQSVPGVAATTLFPAAQPRTLDPLPSYN